MNIRPLLATDLDALLALDAATNPHPWDRLQWQDSLAGHCCIGLEDGDTIAGFAVALPLPDEAELLLIAVDPLRQGQGLGQCLLADLCSVLRKENRERLLLEVRESNLRARHFYAAAGFREIGRRRNYYPCDKGREDALILALDLGGQ